MWSTFSNMLHRYLPSTAGKGQLSEQAMKMPTLAEKAVLLGLTPGKSTGGAGKGPTKKKGSGDRIVISLKATSFGDQQAAHRFKAEATPDAPMPPLFDCRCTLSCTSLDGGVICNYGHKNGEGGGYVSL